MLGVKLRVCKPVHACAVRLYQRTYHSPLQVFGKGDKSGSANQRRSPLREPRVSSVDEPVEEGSVSEGATEKLSPQALREQLEQLQDLACSVKEKDIRKICEWCAF